MNLKKISTIVALLFLSFQALHAQLYKVYGYQPAEAGELEFVIWNSYIPSSDVSYNFFGREMARKGLFAHSLELEYGLSNKFGIAAYFDFEDPKNGSLKYVRTKAIMAHYAFFEKRSRPLDIAIYLEYIINNKDYKDYEELEVRLILEKDIGAFRVDFNPIFEKKTSGIIFSPLWIFISARDCLPEGDRIYHSAFIDSDGNFTYAQWYATKDIENRLKPLEERIEKYQWEVPDKFAGQTVI